MKLILSAIITLALGSTLFGKEVVVDTFLIQKEAEINAQLNIVRAVKDDNQRYLENESLKELVESVLAYPGTFDYPFESFVTLSTLKSPDDAFRLFNWNIEDNNGINTHYCYMILPSRGGKPNEVIPFKEDKITIPPRPDGTLAPVHWYGALYYKIVPIKKGNKTLYTVIGYSGGGRSTNKKLLDVFYFKGKTLRLGYPIFQESAGSSRLLRRVFFEYSEKVTIAVNMNTQLDAIVFDHLTPETPDLEGMYDFYVPDMTYDGYKWDGSKWEYEEDLVAVNDQRKKTRIYGPGEKEGESEFVDVNDEWIDPVDGNPNGGGTSAVAPVENSADTKNKKQKDKKHRKTKGNSKKPRSAIKND